MEKVNLSHIILVSQNTGSVILWRCFFHFTQNDIDIKGNVIYNQTVLQEELTIVDSLIFKKCFFYCN